MFSIISNWVTDALGSAVGAISQSVMQGAVAGAVVGAAHAAIEGGDIFKGALTGAAVGGVGGGIVGAFGQMTGDSTEPLFTESTQGLKGPESGLPPRGLSAKDTISNVGSSGLAAPKPPSAPVQDTTSSPSFFKSDEGKKVIAGIGQGALIGAGNYLSQKEKAKADREYLDHQENIRKQRIKDNKPGASPKIKTISGVETPEEKLKKQTASINVSSWWDKHTGNIKGAA